jgi:nucleotide-binding universal stress UspA family protein
MKINKMIVAVSLEPETSGPLQKIKMMDISPTTEVHLVHIVPVIFYARGMQFNVLTYPLKEERPQVEEGILHKLQTVASELFPQHKNVIFKCIFDSNEKAAFCDYVKEQNADLVVVATRGKHGVTTIFDSSFAQHQLKYSPTNVLILR